MNTMMIRIIAAVVDTHNVTLYKEDGSTLVIPQGDSRIRGIIDDAVPLLLKQGYADVNVASEKDNTYVQFEALTDGKVKLFRIAKDKLIKLMGANATDLAEEVALVTPMSIGSIPTATTTQASSEAAEKQLSAVEEIMQHAVSVNSEEFHEVGIYEQGNVVEQSGETNKNHPTMRSSDCIIAVVDGQVIPNMELIKTQFARAAALGTAVGVENFLRRIAAVIHQRAHSIEDLLKFMERGDLPIADDGSILIYKVLQSRTDDSNKRTFVDCHTRKVKQWVGAYVCMDASLVDHDRRNECSNGLHVARRGYIREFTGDAIVLAKLAPEDVIAVPEYDANKMRVCGYHIIAELGDVERSLVRKNQPITSTEAGKLLLGNALAGIHMGKTHEVRITAQNGDNVIVKSLCTLRELKKEPELLPIKADALSNAADKTAAPHVNPNDVNKQVEQMSRKDKAAQLVDDFVKAATAEAKTSAVGALRAFKKAAKVGWEKLGVAPEIVTQVTLADTSPASTVAQEDTVSRTVVLVQATHEGAPIRERIQKLLAIGLKSPGVADAILSLKKASKKGWNALGVSDKEAEKIMKLANNSN